MSLVSVAVLEARELVRPAAADLLEFFSDILGARAPLAIVLRALEEALTTRLVAAQDDAGPVMLMPFALSADGMAHLGPPLFHPRAAGKEAPALAVAAQKVVSLGARTVILTAPHGEPAAPYLRPAGFSVGPKLLEMSRPTPATPPRREHEWTAYAAEKRPAFAQLFYRTLEGSLDVPEVPVCRDGELLMRAFEERGSFEAEDFCILQTPQGPAALLLAAHAGCALDILYIGVVPQMRGKGLGRVLLRRAFARAARHGVGSLKAFVDARNLPATALYRELGFSEKRAVRVHLWRPENF